MARKLVKWSGVDAGDIVSFKYRSKSSSRGINQTILLLNPRLKVKLKNGTTKEKVIGLKLEESNRKVIRSNYALKLFGLLGELKVVDDSDEKETIYRLKIKEHFIAPWPTGVKKSFYNRTKSIIGKRDIYRTYDYDKVPKTVYLEPIKILK